MIVEQTMFSRPFTKKEIGRLVMDLEEIPLSTFNYYFYMKLKKRLPKSFLHFPTQKGKSKVRRLPPELVSFKDIVLVRFMAENAKSGIKIFNMLKLVQNLNKRLWQMNQEFDLPMILFTDGDEKIGVGAPLGLTTWLLSMSVNEITCLLAFDLGELIASTAEYIKENFDGK